MRILCTNDDGIHAPGLKTVEEIARALSDDVWIVAPELDQSGVSHSLSLNDPLRLREVGPRHFAVGHADRLRDHGLAPHPRREGPRSGAVGRQQGPQRCRGLVYSGTIRRRPRSTILGIPSFALSQEFSIETRHRAAVGHRAAVRSGHPAQGDRRGRAEEHGDQRQFSRLHARPVKACASRVGQPQSSFLKVDKRHDGRGNPYFWIASIGPRRWSAGRAPILQHLRHDTYRSRRCGSIGLTKPSGSADDDAEVTP